MVSRDESDWFLEQLKKNPLMTVEELAGRRDGATILADAFSNRGAIEARGAVIRSIRESVEVRKALRDRVESSLGNDIASFLNEVYRLAGNNKIKPIYRTAVAGILGAVGLAIGNAVGNSTLTGWAIALAIVSSIILIFLLWPTFALQRFFDAVLGKRPERPKWVRNLKITAAAYPAFVFILPWLPTVAGSHGTGQKANQELPQTAPRVSDNTQHQIRTNATDGAEMVFVPAGDFTMGSSEDQINSIYQEGVKVIPSLSRLEYEAEGPQHKVYLDGYWIYKTPVTVSQYKKFSAATGHPMPDTPEWGWKDDHPIVNVLWSDAEAYSRWAGVHLPSEAQWEKAARGTDARQYPWGNKWDETRLQCSKRAPSDAGRTAPVGSFPTGASPYGCLDMAGNVWEWCEDWYGADYYKKSPERNPTGPESGSYRVMRGGSWRYGGPISFMFRVSDRSRQAPEGSTSVRDPDSGGLWKAHDEMGFRCVTAQQD